tara:strand:+ start:763 stop:1020 length:258 start_codon:yes stop_codon:yes gene_type:complete
MKALNDVVIVSEIKEEKKTSGGLLLTDKTDEDNRYKKGSIVTTGHLVDIVNENEVVYYDSRAGHSIAYKDDMYRVIRLKDIVLVE